jgi:hypothetical protein
MIPQIKVILRECRLWQWPHAFKCFYPAIDMLNSKKLAATPPAEKRVPYQEGFCGFSLPSVKNDSNRLAASSRYSVIEIPPREQISAHFPQPVQLSVPDIQGTKTPA